MRSFARRTLSTHQPRPHPTTASLYAVKLSQTPMIKAIMIPGRSARLQTRLRSLQAILHPSSSLLQPLPLCVPNPPPNPRQSAPSIPITATLLLNSPRIMRAEMKCTSCRLYPHLSPLSTSLSSPKAPHVVVILIVAHLSDWILRSLEKKTHRRLKPSLLVGFLALMDWISKERVGHTCPMKR